ncbi:hypothetical protein NDU88_005636 [Pleurodeles waltl]|uniref:Uncharacterized protein n=1 Tax=Pleurodeles waltl TaxID=8319 RepID=A0AAV7TBL6_PLEWA|nr:hypothetical protein NDU88_005636 [Pleurodeles waltl]
MTSRCARRAHKDAWPDGNPTKHGRGALRPTSKVRLTENSPTVPHRALPQPGRCAAAKRKEGKPCRGLDRARQSEEEKGKPCRGLNGARQLRNRRNLTSDACFEASLSSEAGNIKWGLCASRTLEAHGALRLRRTQNLNADVDTCIDFSSGQTRIARISLPRLLAFYQDEEP